MVPKLKELQMYNGRSIGIKMKRTELTKTFMMISNWKKNVHMAYTKISCKGQAPVKPDAYMASS